MLHSTCLHYFMMKDCTRCERVNSSNISQAIGLLRRVASSHNAAAGEAAEAGQEVSAAVTEALEVVTTGGRGSVTGGDLEAMVDMEALLLQCCQQEATTHQQEAASGLKESLMAAPPSLAI
jgi:hypothetical protein